MKLTFENGQYIILGNEGEIIKQTKWSNPIMAFLESHPGEVEFDAADEAQKMKKRMDKRAAKATAPKTQEVAQESTSPAPEVAESCESITSSEPAAEDSPAGETVNEYVVDDGTSVTVISHPEV